MRSATGRRPEPRAMFRLRLGSNHTRISGLGLQDSESEPSKPGSDIALATLTVSTYGDGIGSRFQTMQSMPLKQQLENKMCKRESNREHVGTCWNMLEHVGTCWNIRMLVGLCAVWMLMWCWHVLRKSIGVWCAAARRWQGELSPTAYPSRIVQSADIASVTPRVLTMWERCWANSRSQ